jgi:hypothetical protein
VAFVSRLAQVAVRRQGQRVGYNGTYVVEAEEQRIGIVAAGYNDGVPWRSSNRGEVLVHGRRVRVLGRVSMDLLCVDLTGIAACFSPGVSTNVAFELDLAGRGIQSYMVDASIDALPAHNEAFTFDSLWLGATDDAGSKRISLDSWVSKYAPDPAAGDLLLQMDIEDAEWVTLAAVSRDTLARFRIIVLELHDLTSLASRKGNLYIKSIFKKLREDFDVVHAHPNNYFAPERVKGVSIHPILEITLLRRDRINSSRPTEEFPHPLDSRNLVRRPDVRLRPIWYRQ